MSATLPDARQQILRARLERGLPLELAVVAREFDVSVDTVRRDLKTLEHQGVARCVRGGAMPVARPSEGALHRMEGARPDLDRLVAQALPLVQDGMVLVLDGGSTVHALAQALPALPNSLVVTPAPAVALACLSAGVPVQLIGGRMSGLGAISVGHEAVQAIGRIAADLAFLGVCGLDAGFGLSADDLDEAHVKRAMAAAAHRCVALTGAAKLGRRARHRVVSCGDLDLLITDAPAADLKDFKDQGIEVRNG